MAPFHNSLVNPFDHLLHDRLGCDPASWLASDILAEERKLSELHRSIMNPASLHLLSLEPTSSILARDLTSQLVEQARRDQFNRSIVSSAAEHLKSYLTDFEDNEPDWEQQARRVVEQALEQVRFDTIRRSVLLMSGKDHRFNRTLEEFSRLEDIRHTLIDKAEIEWINYVPYDNGPVFQPDVEAMVEDLLEKSKIVEFFDPSPADEGEELFSAPEFVIPAGGIIIRGDLEEINEELIRYLSAHPEQMRNLHPRKFEALVAELFRHKGYEVELTPRTRDGGLDIRAYYRSDTGSFLTLVECKRYSAKRHVSVDIVRGLLGVVDDERATRGIVATTSSFTKDAKALQERNKYRLHFADFSAIHNWLRDFRNTKPSYPLT